MPSPCIGHCQAKDGLCLGCGRTLTEIGRWSAMDSDAQLAVMAQLDGSTSTHRCPGCGEPAFCAVSAGTTIAECWCSQLPALPMGEASACWCRRCLVKAIAARP
ncbi:TPA: DUF1289 domain-containing protein [Aeromonas hydrophila]|uniref:DUF1289 domain-containing protein n=1 Tax=Aeromonas TaxID=642 RepID=UPI00249E3D68|nr:MULTISPECIES: DUF1289 domain-containing protein [Aeromonas]MDI3429729.1 DUF1289 domain-containing protein [Aeromonas sp. V90_14]HDZ8914937.1 DUF1289 domain-containing protein [Aeromonas hydrophila]